MDIKTQTFYKSKNILGCHKNCLGIYIWMKCQNLFRQDFPIKIDFNIFLGIIEQTKYGTSPQATASFPRDCRLKPCECGWHQPFP